MYPGRSGPPYDAPAFRLGFFAAIAIVGNDITLDLNGFTLQQSEEHALMQRFFSLIELASTPFPPDKGPAAFGGASTFKAANNVRIINGVLGRSSHHGIHGNSNDDVLLKNLVIEDFEVAGVALNGVQNLRMRNVEVRNSRADVPVNPALSQSIFLLQAVSKFLTAPGDSEVATKAAVLRSAVYDYLHSGLDTSDSLFATRTGGLPDGSLLAGIMIAAKFNVDNFETQLPDEDEDDGSFNLVFRNVQVSNLTARPQELGALKYIEEPSDPDTPDTGYGKGRVVDIVAAVFDIDRVVDHQGGTFAYQSNPLADLQLAVAAYALDCQATNATCNQGAEGRLLARNGIPQKVIDWSTAASPETAWEEILADYYIDGNHDAMSHFSKGVVGVKLDGVANAKIRSVNVVSMNNLADFSDRSPLAYAHDPNYLYQGFSSRGVSLASSMRVFGERIAIHEVSATAGPQVCVDAINEVVNTRIQLKDTSN